MRRGLTFVFCGRHDPTRSRLFVFLRKARSRSSDHAHDPEGTGGRGATGPSYRLLPHNAKRADVMWHDMIWYCMPYTATLRDTV